MSDTKRQTLQSGQKCNEVKKVTSLDGVIFSNHGSRIAPVYKRTYVKDLDKNLVKKVDETDLYEFIQASRSTTDLAVLQKRFMELGEIPQVDPNYGSNDLTKYPSNIHEVYSMVNDVDNSWNSLPESIRGIFGSKDSYLRSVLDGTYQATLVAAINQKQEKKEEPAPAPQKGE